VSAPVIGRGEARKQLTVRGSMMLCKAVAEAGRGSHSGNHSGVLFPDALRWAFSERVKEWPTEDESQT
jgi:hypothetical protein